MTEQVIDICTQPTPTPRISTYKKTNDTDPSKFEDAGSPRPILTDWTAEYIYRFRSEKCIQTPHFFGFPSQLMKSKERSYVSFKIITTGFLASPSKPPSYSCSSSCS